MKPWKQTRREARRAGPTRTCASEERGAPVREMRVSRLVRALRSNPNGIGGPLVIRYVATALAKIERGWGPESRRRVPEHELLEWTRVLYIFLVSMSVDLQQTEPDVSADADWALAQVGLSAEQLCGAQGSELERLARLAWEDSTGSA